MKHAINCAGSTLFLLLISIFCSYAQSPKSVIIPLETITGTGSLPEYFAAVNLYEQRDPNYDSARHFSGIPANLKEYMIKYVDFQPEQGVYELYLRLKGRMSQENLMTAFHFYKKRIDTLQLSRTAIKHTVYIITGINANNKHVFIADANNNLNFADDKPFEFTTSLCAEKDRLKLRQQLYKQRVYFEYAANGKVYNRNYNLLLSPCGNSYKYSNANEEKLKVLTGINEYKLGFYTAGKESYEIEAFSNDISHLSYDTVHTTVRISHISSGQEISEPVAAYVGDTIYLNENKYIITGFAAMGDSLKLTFAGKGAQVYGNDSGKVAYTIRAQDIEGRPFNLTEYKGRYVLIDFWGTWCGPCISAIPDLVKLADKYKKNLQVVSLAFDTPDNMPLIKKMIQEKKMNWIHLFEDKRPSAGADKRPVIKQYRVDRFPTQILIDPTGKIILRTLGDKGTDLVDRRLAGLVQ